MLDATQFLCENELALRRLRARLNLDSLLRQKQKNIQPSAQSPNELRWFSDQSFSAIQHSVVGPVVVDSEGLITYLTTEYRTKSRPDDPRKFGDSGLARKQFFVVHIWKADFEGQTFPPKTITEVYT